MKKYEKCDTTTQQKPKNIQRKRWTKENVLYSVLWLYRTEQTASRQLDNKQTNAPMRSLRSA